MRKILSFALISAYLATGFCQASDPICAKALVGETRPLFSKEQQDSLNQLEHHRTLLKTEDERKGSSPDWKAEEISEIRKRENSPSYKKDREVLHLYLRKTNFLLRNLEAVFGKTYADAHLARVTVSEILSETSSELAPWLKIFPAEIRIDHENLRNTLITLFIKTPIRTLTQSQITVAFILRNLEVIRSEMQTRLNQVDSDLRNIRSNLERKDYAALSLRLDGISYKSGENHFTPDQIEDLTSRGQKQLQTLTPEKEKFEKNLQQILERQSTLATQLPEFSISSVLGWIERDTPTCCKRGCSNCPYLRSQKFESSPQEIDTPPPQLAYYQALQELRGILPPEAFEFPHSPDEYKNQLDGLIQPDPKKL